MPRSSCPECWALGSSLRKLSCPWESNTLNPKHNWRKWQQTWESPAQWYLSLKKKWLKLSRGFCNKSNWGYEQKNIIWVLPDNWIQWWRYQSSKFNKTNPTGVARFLVLMASYGYPANYWRESDNILAIHSPAVGKIFFPRMSDPNNLNKMTAPIPSQTKHCFRY